MKLVAVHFMPGVSVSLGRRLQPLTESWTAAKHGELGISCKELPNGDVQITEPVDGIEGRVHTLHPWSIRERVHDQDKQPPQQKGKS